MLSALSSFKDVAGKYMTLNGWLLLVFIGVLAAGAGAGAGALNSDIIASFYTGIWTDPVTGEKGLTEAFQNVGVGTMKMGKSLCTVAAGGVDGYLEGTGAWNGIVETWNQPA